MDSNKEPKSIKSYSLYLSKEQTGLPFDIEVDNHFPNYRAKYRNGMIESLSVSDVINIHLILEIKKNGKSAYQPSKRLR